MRGKDYDRPLLISTHLLPIRRAITHREQGKKNNRLATIEGGIHRLRPTSDWILRAKRLAEGAAKRLGDPAPAICVATLVLERLSPPSKL